MADNGGHQVPQSAGQGSPTADRSCSCPSSCISTGRCACDCQRHGPASAPFSVSFSDLMHDAQLAADGASDGYTLPQIGYDEAVVALGKAVVDAQRVIVDYSEGRLDPLVALGKIGIGLLAVTR